MGARARTETGNFSSPDALKTIRDTFAATRPLSKGELIWVDPLRHQFATVPCQSVDLVLTTDNETTIMFGPEQRSVTIPQGRPYAWECQIDGYEYVAFGEEKRRSWSERLERRRREILQSGGIFVRSRPFSKCRA